MYSGATEIAIRKMNRGEVLTDADIKALPDAHRAFYFLHDDSLKDEDSIIARAKRKESIAARSAKRDREWHIYERSARKVLSNQELTPQEYKIFRKYQETKDEKVKRKQKVLEKRVAIAKAKRIQAARDKALYERACKKLQAWAKLTEEERDILQRYRPTEIEIDASEILTDVVNGDYSLQDVSLVCEGAAALMKDAVESSPIQLFEQVMESAKRQTMQAISTSSNTDQFFSNIDPDLLQSPSFKLNEIVSSCIAGIEAFQGTGSEENEAKHAIESFIKAMVMCEGESKIKEALKMTEMKEKMRQEESLAEVAAVRAMLGGEEEEEDERKPSELGFNITKTEFEVSFMPTDDPEVYKPLEIISYIGLTK
jgi:hypothetical protein